jgi:hypothetical protein
MDLKTMRYNVMLALYFPILLYAVTTFDLSDDTVAISDDDLVPVVIGEQTVLLGQPFEAKAFLTLGGDAAGRTLNTQGDLTSVGDSVVRMSTGALLGPEENETTVPYSGTFAFERLGGQVVEREFSGTYNVRRPEIVAQAEGLAALYRQSANPIRIDVPGLEDRQLKLKVGDNVTEGRTVTLAPSGDGASVEVFLAAEEGEEDVFLGRKSFSAIDPPRPEIRVTNAGRSISSGDNIPRRRAQLQFIVEPDEQFRQRYPSDARYSISSATVSIRRGLTATEELGTVSLSGGSLTLTRQLRDARPGDRVIIKLNGVSRINYAGRAVAVPLSEGSRTFGFTVS